jgi:hypothetical protein
MSKSIPLLHVHNQSFQHDDAFLIGNRQALEMLKASIEEALKVKECSLNLYTADGEEYFLHIFCDDSEWQGERWQNALLPYTAPEACVIISTKTIFPSHRLRDKKGWREVGGEGM